MGGIVTTVTDALGLTDTEGAEDAQRAANASSKEAVALARENLEFQKEKYADWESVYGPIQENLGKYFSDLGSENVVALGLREQQIAHQRSSQQIKQNLARRGLGDSGFEAYVESSAELANEQKRAEIRATADQSVAQQQMGFLGLGLGQGTQMLGLANSASGLAVNALGQQAGIHNNQFGSINANNGAMLRQIYSDASTTAGYYANKKG